MQTILTKHSESFRDLWGLIGLAVLVIVLVSLALWLLVSQNSMALGPREGQNPMDGLSQIAFTAETGIRVVRVNIASGGGIVNLRYQVVDPDKAVIVHAKESPPGIVDEANGQLLNIPFHSHTNSRELRTGTVYSILINNTGGVLKPGSLVTVLVGEARLEHVVVQ